MTEEASLDLLHFTVGGVRLAAMADQIAWIGDADEVEEGEATRITDVMDLGVGAQEANFATVLGVRMPGGGEAALLVEKLDSIERAYVGQLKPLPPIAEKHALACGVWAATEREGTYAFLLDLHRLMDERGFKKRTGNQSVEGFTSEG